MNKKKWGIGIGVVIALGVIGNFLPESEVKEPVAQETSKEEVQETLTKEELIERLEGYETIYSNNLDGLAKAADTGNQTEMQKLFSSTADASSATFEILYDLKKGYEPKSNEYKVINELQTAFNSLKDACKNGVKYIDSNDSKDLEKYEENIEQSNLFIERYNEAKNNL